jgi:peptidoglycan/LPS O-acetylase OafA/YrhL
VSELVPELRTSRTFAIALSVLALAALGLALTQGDQLDDPLGSETATTIVLAVWCVVGAGAAIVAIVDAYIRPDGEVLGLITSIAATVFGLLALAITIGIVVGATGVVDEEAPADSADLETRTFGDL